MANFEEKKVAAYIPKNTVHTIMDRTRRQRKQLVCRQLQMYYAPPVADPGAEGAAASPWIRHWGPSLV